MERRRRVGEHRDGLLVGQLHHRHIHVLQRLQSAVRGLRHLRQQFARSGDGRSQLRVEHGRRRLLRGRVPRLQRGDQSRARPVQCAGHIGDECGRQSDHRELRVRPQQEWPDDELAEQRRRSVPSERSVPARAAGTARQSHLRHLPQQRDSRQQRPKRSWQWVQPRLDAGTCRHRRGADRHRVRRADPQPDLQQQRLGRCADRLPGQ